MKPSFVILLSLAVTPVIFGDGMIRLQRTGQTVSYATGDDGDLNAGVAWPETKLPLPRRSFRATTWQSPGLLRGPP